MIILWHAGESIEAAENDAGACRQILPKRFPERESWIRHLLFVEVVDNVRGLLDEEGGDGVFVQGCDNCRLRAQMSRYHLERFQHGRATGDEKNFHDWSPFTMSESSVSAAHRQSLVSEVGILRITHVCQRYSQL